MKRTHRENGILHAIFMYCELFIQSFSALVIGAGGGVGHIATQVND
jgi:NADPH:quinone reductase-like Zn-dependent oxidoreductase